MPMPNLGEKLKAGKLSVNGEAPRGDVAFARNVDRSLLDRLVDVADAAKAGRSKEAP